MLRLSTLCLVTVLPTMGLADWTNDDDTDTGSTETVETCSDGMIWDLQTESCLPPDQSTNDDAARLDDARRLAEDKQYLAALGVLETLEEQHNTDVLTYLGFVHRKSGNVALGLSYYDAALTLDPNNYLARSYLGQAHIEAGAFDQAKAQLSEIRARGGRNTWAERSLMMALRSGGAVGY